MRQIHLVAAEGSRPSSEIRSSDVSSSCDVSGSCRLNRIYAARVAAVKLLRRVIRASRSQISDLKFQTATARYEIGNLQFCAKRGLLPAFHFGEVVIDGAVGVEAVVDANLCEHEPSPNDYLSSDEPSQPWQA